MRYRMGASRRVRPSTVGLWVVCICLMLAAALYSVAEGYGTMVTARQAYQDQPASPSEWLQTVQQCDRPDGSGELQTYPCVVRGAVSVVVYVRGSDAGCPEHEWRALPPGSLCIDVDAWTGETENEEIYYY